MNEIKETGQLAGAIAPSPLRQRIAFQGPGREETSLRGVVAARQVSQPVQRIGDRDVVSSVLTLLGVLRRYECKDVLALSQSSWQRRSESNQNGRADPRCMHSFAGGVDAARTLSGELEEGALFHSRA
eukprot:6179945-Pleurochrysis_carterae.AAC.5